MKRKFKLITTIACLCLALTVMITGVVAASSVSYTLTNSITYEIKDAMAKISTTVYKTSSTTLATSADNLSSLTYPTSVQTVEVQSYDSNNLPTDLARTGDTLDMNFNTAYAYKVVVTVTTISGSGVFVAATAPVLASGANLLLKADATVAKPASANCTTSSVFTYTYYVGLKTPTTAIGSNKTDLFTTSCKITVSAS